MSKKTGCDLKQENSLLKSFGYAASGIAQAASERNFKVDCVATAGALLLCALLQVPAWGWIAVIMCCGIQLALEALNTAIEAVVDLCSPEIHPLAKRAKDCAAGAALITACMSVAVAAAVYIPAALALFGVI